MSDSLDLRPAGDSRSDELWSDVQAGSGAPEQSSSHAADGGGGQRCAAGHAVRAGDAFCSTCGAPVYRTPAATGHERVRPLGPDSGWATPPSGTTAAMTYTDAPVAKEPSRMDRRRLWLIAALVLVLAGGAGTGIFLILNGGTPAATIGGTFTLTDDTTAGAGCVGQGEDSGLGNGTTATLSTASGTSIATTKLATGSATGGVCTYRFEFPKTQANLPSYSVTVGSLPAKTMTKSELKSSGWQFDLRYGPPTTTITGTLELSDVDTALADCVGQGGYSDISAGVILNEFLPQISRRGVTTMAARRTRIAELVS